MKLSILTATYNRAKFLKRIYDSILKNLNFGLEAEWIIIDDGSSDDTYDVVNKFILEDKFKIKYIYQQNLGKMSAINKAVQIATGELIVDCDSDDFFTDNAFEIINKNSKKLLENPKLYALCFFKKDTHGNISGNKFKSDELISTMFDLYFKDNVMGEKILVFNAKIRKFFKHELEAGEKFVTEARMYHKMDEDYKILCINEPIEIGDYMPDGYTNNIMNTFRSSPQGYYCYFKEILKKDLKNVTFRKKLYVMKHFVLFTFLRFFKLY